MNKIRIKSFQKSKIYLQLPYLLDIQRKSWELFCENDLKELFEEISPIKDYGGKDMELWFLDYRLDKSNYKNDLDAKENNDSFEAPLRINTKLVNLKTKETKQQEIFLADFPLMTERQTFIINGVERVLISQLIRSPGAFFTMKKAVGKNNFGAKVIPNRGAWLEFETESSGFIGVRIDRRRKVAATTLLRAFGIESLDYAGEAISEDEKILALFKDIDNGETKYIEKTLEKDTTHNKEEALMEVYKRLRPGDMASVDTARELVENMFFNFKRYDLSEVGRWKTLQRLPELQKNWKENQAITKEDRTLTSKDILAVLREIIRLNNKKGAKPDQIDHLGNRRVRTMNEFLKNRLRIALMRMERIIKDRMLTLDAYDLTPSQLINPKPFIAIIKEFFSTSQMSQFTDNQNPLAELEHKRRLSATGPGGLTRERAGFEARDVQPSHYGRICPIQSPEGPNIGLVNHLASYTQINKYGFMETPYFKVENGKATSTIRYMNAYEDEKYNIACAGVLMDDNGNIISKKVEARIKGEPGIISPNKIDYIDVSPEQAISIATGLIPFLKNDDANRALMGSNMQRQSVPCINSDVPLVCTGLEEKVARDSGQEIIANEDGIVIEADAKHIKIKSSKDNKEKIYNLRTFVRTNQYTCFHQRPIVKKGQKIKRDDILTTGGAIESGYLSLGRNLLVAFMSWRGQNFEDAIVLSERLTKYDYFSSIHVEDFTCDVRETKLGPEITTCDIPNIGEEKLKDLDDEGVIRVGAEVGTNSILVGKISPKGEVRLTAEERLLRAIFGDKAKEVKDTSLIMKHGKKGRVVSVKVFDREMGHKLESGVIKRIRIEIAEIRKVQPGDKISGRHGNKGVVSIILPEEDMPFMKDGTPVDIVLNPLGVVSRMNIGQILETHLGWAAKELGYTAITPGLGGADEKEIKEELKKAGLPEDGKITLYDGYTGIPFSEKITVGYIYMLKLIHMVEDKLHMRSIGPYSLITQQPLGGKAQSGGQRLGEMEVWALEGYGAAYMLQEMLTIKSDDVQGRALAYESILRGEDVKTPSIPASFNLLVNELKALALDIDLGEQHKKTETNN
ncbi:MAG: DNA-directed RNA polymerase subunit beta [Patescibacteria group bacterium]|nr:DNA-directed RNA polymerase subunit beta [Patescibacteria group bacterium]